MVKYPSASIINRTPSRKPKESFFEKLRKLKEEYADVLADPTFDGLPLPEREVPNEEYDRKIANLWAE